MNVSIIIPSQNNSYRQNYNEYPLGAGYIGTSLKEAGFKVNILDQTAENLSNNEVVAKIISSDCQWALFSIVSSTYSNAINLLKLLQKRNSEIKTVAGGVHPSIFPERTLMDGFDFVIKGEGEMSLPLLLSNHLKIHKIQIPGLYFKDSTSIKSYKQGLPVPLDRPVDRSLYNLELYSHHTVCFSRGCLYGCKFCCDIFRNSGKTFIRSTSPECIENELIEIDKLGGNVFFADDIFMQYDKNLNLFTDIYQSNNLKFKWTAQLRADMVSDSRVGKMVKNGCQRIYIGCEAGSDEILRNAGKGIKAHQISTAIDIIRKNGITVKTGWIYGLPGSLDEQYKSINLMLASRPNYISIHMLIPFPGTYFFRFREKYGIFIDDPFNFDVYSYSGLNPAIKYAYLPADKLLRLFHDTEKVLQENGYVPSDKARHDSKYIYATPLQFNPINVFQD